MRLVIVVPAFNEEQRIEECVRVLGAPSLVEALAAKGVDETLVYVVDDGSSDRTGALAERAGASRVIRHRVNRGLGAAVRSGLMAARNDGADLVVKFDADLQHDPADIPRMIEPLLADEADVVYGNRFSRIEYRMPLMRAVGNRVFRQLMRWLTGWPLKDSQPGIFAINRAYLDEAYLPGDYNYTQQILLDAYLKGMRFEHVDVAFRERKTGRSFISLKYPFRVLPQILLVLVAVKPMKVFLPIGGFGIGIALLVALVEIAMWLTLDHVTKPIEHVNFVMGMGLFGVQILFLGLIAQLILMTRGR